MNLLKFDTDVASLRGVRHRINQDAYLAHAEIGLWCVADGAGGHSRGEVASQILINALSQINEYLVFDDLDKRIRQILLNVNQYLLRIGESNYGGVVAATALILMIQNQRARCFWVGDSRLYLIRNQHIYQITRDHNYGAFLADQGVNANEIQFDHQRFQLTQAIGASLDLQLEYKDFICLPGDMLILCSDGLTKVVSEYEILHVIQHNKSTKSVLNSLMQKAHEKGARDDVTVICLEALV